MDFKSFDIEGPKLLIPKVFKDDRGNFQESYNKEKYKAIIGEDINFVQDNSSVSIFGSLRGLHFQKPPYAQTKLVSVVLGTVIDVIVDLRADSKTYGQHLSVELNDENNYQLLVPKGFAHGFVTMSEKAIFNYKVDAYYNPDSDSGIIFNDSTLNIDWPLNKTDYKLSAKDLELQSFNAYRSNPDF